MSVGTIIGVVVALLVAGILGTITFLLYRRRRLILKLGNRHTILEAYRDRRPRAPPSTIAPFRTTHTFPSYHHAPPSTTSMSSFVANSNPSLRQADKRPIPDMQKRDRLVNTTPRNYQNAEEPGPPFGEEDSDICSFNGARSEGSERSVHHEAIKR